MTGIEQFSAGLRRTSSAVFRDHPELVDHRAEFPWLLGALGDPSTPVWFVAENPSLTQVRRFDGSASPEVQWSASRGDGLFREALAMHGFKTGGAFEPGGWRCYITDVIKSAEVANEWRQRPEADQLNVAEAWAPVLSFELEQGDPKLLVVLGGAARKLLAHLVRRGLLPDLPPQRVIYHYSYIASRPEPGGLRRGPGHPDRVAEWHLEFEEIAQQYPPSNS